MSGNFRLSLKSGETLYINGAVIRTDRKVTLELLNDVSFLLAQHILSADETTTPLRQMYFVVQTMLMEPKAMAETRALYARMLVDTARTFTNYDILGGLVQMSRHVDEERYFDALKVLRGLIRLEDDIAKANPPQALQWASSQ